MRHVGAVNFRILLGGHRRRIRKIVPGTPPDVVGVLVEFLLAVEGEKHLGSVADIVVAAQTQLPAVNRQIQDLLIICAERIGIRIDNPTLLEPNEANY